MRRECSPGSISATMAPAHDSPGSGNCCLHLSFQASGRLQYSATLPGHSQATATVWPWLTAPFCVLSYALHTLQKIVPLLSPPQIILLSGCHLLGSRLIQTLEAMESHRRIVSRSDAPSDLHFRQLTVAVREGWILEREMGWEVMQRMSRGSRINCSFCHHHTGNSWEWGQGPVLLHAFNYNFLVDCLQRWPEESRQVSQPFLL